VSDQAPDAPKPWERQPKETAKQYQAFAIYRDLQAETRSLLAVTVKLYGKEVKHARGSIQVWSSRNNWKERVRAWDNHLEAVRIRQIEEAARVEQGMLDDERRELKLAVLRFSKRAIAKAEQMLDFPLAQVVTTEENGRVTNIVKPGKFAIRDASLMVLHGVQMMKEVLGDDEGADKDIEYRFEYPEDDSPEKANRGLASCSPGTP